MVRQQGQAARSKSRTYIAWYGMLQRCTNPSRSDWPRYGGRGISVSPRWRRFGNFLADMGECPAGLWLDRIDNEGNYEPGNCRWTTFEVQMHNRRPVAGELHGNAKLTVREVVAIRTLASRGLTHRRLASMFGVSHTEIGGIVRRELWRQLLTKPRTETNSQMLDPGSPRCDVEDAGRIKVVE